jgi:hypothetical protein
MSEVDNKNKEIIYELVKKYFDLDKKSLELFKLRLFFEPAIADEYMELIGKSEENRKYYELNDDILESLDRGWALFKSYFKSFVRDNNITYSHFKKNNFPVDGQILKASKALTKYYLNSNYPVRFMFDFSSIMEREIIDILFSKRILKPKIQLIRSLSLSETDSNKIRVSYMSNEGMKVSAININQQIINEKYTEITPIFTEVISELLERVGTRKSPNNKLYLVLSCNFADWFMCSTAEEWGSCLNLQSDCCCCYWSGLPGLIGDKNRAMIYITDGSKKSYRGIVVDKMITRSWIITVRNDKKSPTEISFVKSYPGIMNLREVASSVMGIDLPCLEEDSIEDKKSAYYFDMLYHNYSDNKKVNCNIYQDVLEVHIAKKNKAKKVPLEYGYYKVGERGRNYIFIEKEKIISNDDDVVDDAFYISGEEEFQGLDYLINMNKSLASFREEQEETQDDEE